jgi:hypothetical protein
MRGLNETDAVLWIALVFIFMAAFLSGREEQAPSIFRATCAFLSKSGGFFCGGMA